MKHFRSQLPYGDFTISYQRALCFFSNRYAEISISVFNPNLKEKTHENKMEIKTEAAKALAPTSRS
jgi:hypothetical protein